MAIILNGTTGFDLPVPLAVSEGGTGGETLDSAGIVTKTDTQTLTNKTLSDPIFNIGGSQGTAGQVPVSQGAGLPPVWGDAGEGFETGDILYTSRSLTAPEWLPADGGVYLQSSYPTLFARLGLGPSKVTAADWTARTSGFGTNTIYGVTYDNGLFVAVGSSGTLTTSPDGYDTTTQFATPISNAAFSNSPAYVKA